MRYSTAADPLGMIEYSTEEYIDIAVRHQVANQVAEAVKKAQPSQPVSELRERCVMAQLRVCPEVSAKQITTEAEIMVQYILNGAEKE